MQDFSNPLTYALLHTSTKPIDLARELDISRQYISLAEKGCHVNLNSKLIRWIVKQLEGHFKDGIKYREVGEWYVNFKLNKRENKRIQLGGTTPLSDFPKIDKYVFSREEYREEFINWRRTYWDSGYKFAVDMCIHPYSVETWEKGKYSNMPDDIYNLMIWLEKKSKEVTSV